MLPKTDQETIISMINPEKPEEVNYDVDLSNFPYAKTCDVFNIFPDFGNGPLQYVTERGVNSYENFLTSFSSLINDEENLSPFKDIINSLAVDGTKANFEDFGIVKYQIYQDINYECYANDTFIQQNPQNLLTPDSKTTHDNDLSANIGNVEWLYTVDRHEIVIHMNGFPVYIGKNKYGFVPYVIVSTQDKDKHVGCEGVPYLIRGPAQIIDTHVNKYID